MKYVPLVIMGLILLLGLCLPFCSNGDNGYRAPKGVVDTSQQQSYQEPQEEVMEGAQGRFKVKDVEEAMYKEGFKDGFDGKQGWWIVENFDLRYQSVIGKPENKKQKEDYKKYRDRMYEAYTQGVKDGFDKDQIIL